MARTTTHAKVGAEKAHRFVDCVAVVVQVVDVHRAHDLANDPVGHRHKHFSGIDRVVAALVGVHDAHCHRAVYGDGDIVFGDDVLRHRDMGISKMMRRECDY